MRRSSRLKKIRREGGKMQVVFYYRGALSKKWGDGE